MGLTVGIGAPEVRHPQVEAGVEIDARASPPRGVVTVSIMTGWIIEERPWDDPAGMALRAEQVAGSELSVCFGRELSPA
jgi:hypothetical protein